MLPITIISDCRDSNASMRLVTRAAALVPGAGQVSFCGVENDLEAAGHLVDALDALDGRPGLIMLNVAPRNDHAKKWPNGSPFGHFRVGQARVFATVGGRELSLLAKLTGQPVTVALFDVPTASAHLGVAPEVAARVATTQFRSYDFLPRAAVAMLSGKGIPTTSYSYEVAAPQAVWYVDVFGNVKLTLVPEEVGFEPGKWLSLQIPGRGVLNVACFNGLAAIPDNTPGLTVGSSGLGEKRFLELQVQGGSAAELLALAATTAVTPIRTGNGEARTARAHEEMQA